MLRMTRPSTGKQMSTTLPMAIGSRPASRQLTAKPSSPAEQRLGTAAKTASRTCTAPGAELGALAQKLILKLRAKFGDAAANLKSQEIITNEVTAFIKQGVKVKEEDLTLLECRIRQKLTGGTPPQNTLANDKKAQFEGDEWAKIFQYQLKEGAERDRLEKLALKEKQRKTRETLQGQLQERNAIQQAEKQDEMEYAAQEQAALKVWEATEAARKQLQHEIAVRLKQEREEQLVDKNKRRQAALARAKADDELRAAKNAYETRVEFEKEEAQRQEAKQALRAFLLKNEENKVLKQQAKLAAWEEDAYFQQAWRDVLDKQDRARTERLERNMKRQAKTAEYAASGALPEYKKWIDPAITERQFQEREKALDLEEKQRKARQQQLAQQTAAQLKQQMQEREQRQQTTRQHDEALAATVLKRAAAEEAKEAAKQQAHAAGKLTFRAQLEQQMKDNVHRKRNQPMSEVERSLNHDLLARVQDWKLTGKVNVSL